MTTPCRPVLFTTVSALVALLGSVAATAVIPQLHSAGDRIVFPDRYAEGVTYTTADDPVRTRRWTAELENAAQYATAGAIKALRSGEPILSSHLTKRRPGWGAEYPRETGEWDFQDFTADARQPSTPLFCEDSFDLVERRRLQFKQDWIKIGTRFHHLTA